MENEQETPAKEPTWKDAVVIVTLKLIDAGLAPWVAAAMFILGAMWLCMRNLDSKDTLTLMTAFGSIKGLAWVGWPLAFIQIPILRWAMKREKRMSKSKIERLEAEHAKALELLKKYKLGQFSLENG
jgi:hypothetical protein